MTQPGAQSALLAPRRDRPWRLRLADYWALTKPEVNLLVVATTLVGFYLGSRGPIKLGLLFHALLGTFLVASGTATLNQFMERRYDGEMRRTARRPLPGGRISPRHALLFGLALSAAGGLYLAAAANALASICALLTLGTYLLVYTPLKRRTAWCMFVGAFPGAMPPLIGWAAARGSLDAAAWTLYAIVFFWQFPHFLSIAWMYREDYARAGYRMLPPDERAGRSMAWQVLAGSLLLIPVSLLPAWLGQVGTVYRVGALLLGLALFSYGARLARARSNSLARRLLLASVVYLPLVCGLLIVDKVSS
jgi:protoheme IX farnesyltransferase